MWVYMGAHSSMRGGMGWNLARYWDRTANTGIKSQAGRTNKAHGVDTPPTGNWEHAWDFFFFTFYFHQAQAGVGIPIFPLSTTREWELIKFFVVL